MQVNSFKRQLAADNQNVFLNPAEFADKRTIIYDGETYTDVPCVLTGAEETKRQQLASDHAPGFYQVAAVLYCALADLGGVQPEQGGYIKINDEPGSDFFNKYCVEASICEMGMLEVELEMISE